MKSRGWLGMYLKKLVIEIELNVLNSIDEYQHFIGDKRRSFTL